MILSERPNISTMATARVHCLFALATTLAIVSSTSLPFKGYTITVPNIIIRNATTKACVTFYGIDTDVSVLFRLKAVKRTREQTQEEYFEHGNGRCVVLHVPAFINRRKANLTTEVTAKGAPGESPEVLPAQTKQLRVLLKDLVTFIQTDKPLYKPGQTVRFRIFNIKTDLTPTSETVPLIYLDNAEGYRIKQWNDTQTTKGLAELEFELSDVTSLGTWQISVDFRDVITRKSFKVDEYVLPRFEVSIETPRYILKNSTAFPVKFCARYPYKKSVSGHYTFEACAGMHCLRTTGMVSGCHTVNVTSPVWALIGAFQVEAQANVTDNSSGISLSSPVNIINVTRSDTLVNFVDLEKNYFKPGIPFKGKVRARHTDGRAAVHEDLRVTLWHYGDPPGRAEEQHHEQVVRTGPTGEAAFTIPAVSHSVERYSIRVSHPSTQAPPEFLCNATLRRWYSPYHNYIQIHPPEEPLPACTSEINVDFAYISTESHEQNTSLAYQVLLDNGVPHAAGQLYQVLEPSLVVGQSLGNLEHPDVRRDTIKHGQDPKNRRYRDNRSNTVVIPEPSHHVGVYGRIKQWSFYATRSYGIHWLNRYNKFYLQVWRPDDGENLTYTLVGQTRMRYNQKGLYVVDLPDDMEIAVQPNDVIGVYNPYRHPIGFATNDCARGHVIVYDLEGTSGRVKVGNRFTFTPIQSDIPCREYAMQAYISVDNYIAELVDQHMEPRTVSLTIPLQEPMPSSGKLIVYYVTARGEVVADTLRLDVPPCLQNQVHMEFLSSEAYPGDRVFYRLSARQGSLCTIGMVDRSVYLLQTASNFHEEQVLDNAVSTYGSREPPNIQRTCANKDDFPLADTLDAFGLSGITVLTNLQADNRPCPPTEPPTTTSMLDLKISPSGVYGPSPSQDQPLPLDSLPREPEFEGLYESGAEDVVPIRDVLLSPGFAAVERRFYFPETWLWNTHVIGESGQSLLNGTLPHTLTEWQGSSVCLHDSAGLGVSNEAHIRAFQPFFLSLDLPYSIRRMEHLHLRLIIYSYLDECFELRVTMEPASGIAFVGGDYDQVICMCEAKSISVPYEIAASELGRQNVTFRAQSVQGQGACTELTEELPASDAITRTLLVEPEGTEEEYTVTHLLSQEGYSQETIQYFNLSLPHNVVPGSAKGHIAVIADVMGPTLDGVHKFLRIPSGSGLQNLAKLAVNVMALEYLETTEQLTTKHRKKAMKYIEDGYQKQLQYRNLDGSYSAYGNARDGPSLWLTAFVAKTFAHVRRYTFVDTFAFFETVTWIRRQQGEDGCFEGKGLVHSHLTLGSDSQSQSNVALTAYVLEALFQAGMSNYDQEVIKGVRCLADAGEELDVYTRALMTSVYTHREDDHLHLHHHLEMLANLSRNDGGLTYWKVAPDDSITPIDIETTAYILRAILSRGRRQDRVEGARIVRWLTKQRNGRGGFMSTQDTVVAIEALSKYATLTFVQDVDMRVQFFQSVPEDTVHHLAIDSGNRMVVERWPVTALPREVRVGVRGIGDILLQATVQYNIAPVIQRDAHFAVDLDVRPVEHPLANQSDDCPEYHCHVRRLFICARYTGPNVYATTTVMEIRMVSGWQHHDESLQHELREHDLIYDYSLEETSLHLFYWKMTHLHTCVNIMLERMADVTNTVAAEIVITEVNLGGDYAQMTSYQIGPVCSEEEEERFCFPDIISE